MKDGLTTIERKILSSDYWGKNRELEISKLFAGNCYNNLDILNIGAGASSEHVKNVICSKVNKIIQVDRVNLPGIDEVADATNLPFETESFDIVLFLRVLHHIEDFNKALEEAYRVTKEGGTILLSEPHHKFVYLQDFIGLGKHPKKVVSRNDIIEFGKKNNLNVNELGRLFLFYYGFQLTKI